MRVKSSTIRHIAILAGEPGKILGVYKTAYGLNEVARNGEAIYLSDGHIWFFCRHGPAVKRFIILVSKWKTSKAPVRRRPPPRVELPIKRRLVVTFVLDPGGTQVDLSPGWKI